MQQIYQIFPLIGLYIIIMTIIYAYKFFNTKDVLKAWYKKRLIVNSISLVILFVFYFFFSLSQNMVGIGQGGSVPIPALSGSYSTNTSRTMMPDFYRNDYNNYGNNNVNISDTREFIKKTFSATLKIREVESTAKKVEVLIKGMDGRIDSSNVSTQYGYFTFVIPKSKLDEFELQLRTYTNVKFYSQQVSSQNLLNEKQNLERNQDTTKNSISSLTTQQKQISDDFTKTSKTLKEELSTKNTQLKTIQNTILQKESALTVATDTAIRATLVNQLTSLRQSEQNANRNIQAITLNLTTATNNFKSQMSNFGISLSQQNSMLANLGVQENNFFDNIETVNGTVSINYISVWEIIDLYSPVNPFIILMIAFFGMRIFFLLKKEKELPILAA